MPYFYPNGIETSRLQTRYLTENDAKAWSVFFDDPDSVKYIPDFGFTSSVEKAAHIIFRQTERYKSKNYGLQALILKESEVLIGLCGLLAQEVNGRREVEIGYHLLKEFRGNGYAREAANAFKHLAFNHQQCSSVISIIDINNIPSQKVAEANGMIREEKTKWLELEVFIYRINSEAK